MKLWRKQIALAGVVSTGDPPMIATRYGKLKLWRLALSLPFTGIGWVFCGAGLGTDLRLERLLSARR